MKIEFEEYSRLYLDLSWIWLNDPEIKKLTNTPTFTKNDQETWFKSLESKPDYIVFGISADRKPIGVCGLKNISLIDCEYWGFIGDKAYWGKGIGKIVMQEMENRAKKLGLNSIWLKVVPQNTRAQKLYSKMAFIVEFQDEDMIYMRKKV